MPQVTLSIVGRNPTPSVLALPQRNVKRLLAYSGIAQIGTMLLGLIAQTSQGVALLLFYLAAYLFTLGGDMRYRRRATTSLTHPRVA